MDQLKAKFAQKALPLAEELRAFTKAYGNEIVDQVTIDQVVNGARDVLSMITETSELSATEGISFRGYSIPQLIELLPKVAGDDQPLPEGIFYLMLTGDLPTQTDVEFITKEWQRRSEIPDYVFKGLETLPLDTHPMIQFSQGILAMQPTSVYFAKYKSIGRKEYWDPMYEDVMNLLARLPRLAAYIYRRTYHDGKHIAPNNELDWAGNFAHMMGINDPEFKKLMRLYMTIHADHEGGNASANTTHLVGSTLADAYLAFSAGMNALAGPLHGLANQEVIRWVLEMVEKTGTRNLSKQQIADYITATLDRGEVVPGYGHAVLRITDPRYMAQLNYCKKYFPDDEIVNIIWKIYEVAPDLLREKSRTKNPWPNVDAHSGATLMHYGVTEYNFYTVLFGVSRAMGVLASLVWSRALNLPIVRPKSISFESLKALVALPVAK